MKVALLGFGVVGSGVAKIVDGAENDEMGDISIKKILVHTPAKMRQDPRCVVDINEILDDPEIDVVCECIGGLEPAHTYVKEALERGKSCITSNKKMIASFASELFPLAQEKGVALAYESSVGGGIPWIANIERIRRLEEVKSFRGIFNGTTNYILSAMDQEGSDFAECLQMAQELGYAEADPSDDIDGFDVRYKVALSCLAAFRRYVKPEDIITWGVRRISKQDFIWAKDHKLSIKLVGQARENKGGLSAYVLPLMFRNDHLLSNVSANFNALELDSANLGTAAFVGQGAGSLPTAHALVQDILDVNEGRHLDMSQAKPAELKDPEAASYYLRTKQGEFFDQAGVIKEQVGKDAYVTKPLPLSRINDLAKQAGDDGLFLAEVEL